MSLFYCTSLAVAWIAHDLMTARIAGMTCRGSYIPQVICIVGVKYGAGLAILLV